MNVVYLDGSFLPADEARVSVLDRGFVFGDGIYEVTPAYGGDLFLFERHEARMREGLAALGIELDLGGMRTLHEELLSRNQLADAPLAYVYVQVTRGAAPRTHAFPTVETVPTVFGFARSFRRPDTARWEKGFTAITVPDRRWARVDIKSIALLPNVLAQQEAVAAGADEALFVREGVAMEGAHNNLFVISRGRLHTHPATNRILHGITRGLVIELAAEIGVEVRERSVPIEEVRVADELFFTGTTTEIRPCVRLDDRPIADGTVGPVTRAIAEAFVRRVELERAATAANLSGDRRSARGDAVG